VKPIADPTSQGMYFNACSLQELLYSDCFVTSLKFSDAQKLFALAGYQVF
jgi:hypothetical protein